MENMVMENMVMDMVIEWNRACFASHPEVLARKWLASGDLDLGPRLAALLVPFHMHCRATAVARPRILHEDERAGR